MHFITHEFGGGNREKGLEVAANWGAEIFKLAFGPEMWCGTFATRCTVMSSTVWGVSQKWDSTLHGAGSSALRAILSPNGDP